MSDYTYRKAILHQLAAPSSVAAQADLATPTAALGAATGAARTQAQALRADVRYDTAKQTEGSREFTAKLDLGKQRLAETDREFMAKLDLDRKQIDDWAKENTWATAIAVGNIGLTGLGYAAQTRKEETTNRKLNDIAAERRKQTGLMEKYLADRRFNNARWRQTNDGYPDQ